MNDKSSDNSNESKSVAKNTWIKPTLITLAVVIGVYIAGSFFFSEGRGFFRGGYMMDGKSRMHDGESYGWHMKYGNDEEETNGNIEDKK